MFPSKYLRGLRRLHRRPGRNPVTSDGLVAVWVHVSLVESFTSVGKLIEGDAII